MEASRNDPGAGMRQGRGSNERSGEQHDRKHTPTQATVQSTGRGGVAGVVGIRLA